MSILTAEYDFDTAMAVKQEEAYAIGLERGIERGLERGRQEGIERGAYQNKLETARTFLSMGFSPQQVAQGTGLPLETVLQLMDY